MKKISIRENKKILSAAALVILVVLLSPIILNSLATGLVSSSWPTFRQNTMHTGLSPFVGSPSSVLKWSYRTGNGVPGSPTIGPDGTIYIGSMDNKLYAITPAGGLKWSYATAYQIMSSPAIDSDGTVYVGGWDANLYAITPAGGLKWNYATSTGVQSSPAIGSDGTIYVGGDVFLYAIGSIDENNAVFLENILVDLNHLPQETSASGSTTLTPASNSMVIFTSPDGNVGRVTVSLCASGMKSSYKFIVLYYTNPSIPSAYISKTVAKGTITMGFTDTAAAWKVQVMVTFPKATGSVSVTYAYAATNQS